MWKRIGLLGIVTLASTCWLFAGSLYAFSFSNASVEDQIEAAYESSDIMELIRSQQHDKLFEFADSLLVVAIDNDIPYWEGRLNYLKGYLADDLDQGENSLRWFLSASYAFESADSLEWAAKSFNSIGGLFYQLEDLDRALSYYQQSLDYRSSRSNDKSLARVYTNIGKIYYQQNELDLAKVYFEKALQLTDSKPSRQNILVDLGRIAQSIGNTDQAESLFASAIEIGQEYQSKQAYAHAFTNIGVIKYDQKNFSEARGHFLKAVELLKSGHQNDQELIPYYYLAMMSKVEGDFDEAMGLFDSALLVFNFNHTELTESCFDEYLQILFDKADWPKYAEVNKRYNNYLKQRAEKSNDYALLEQRYNFRQVEQEYLNQRAQASVSTPNYVGNILWGVGLLFILLTLGYYMHQAQQRKDQLNKLKKNAAAAYMDAYEFLYGDDPEA